MSDALRAELARVASRLGADGVEFVLERPRDAGHGDLATNLAMVLARRERANPRKTAERVLEELQLSPEPGRSAPRSPAPASSTSGWRRISSPRPTAASLSRAPATAARPSGAGLKVNVEFVSANPTGPLHVGHGRGAALGDAHRGAARVDRPRGDARVLRQRRWACRSTAWRRASGRGCASSRPHGRDPRGRLPRRVPARKRPRGARAGRRRFRRAPRRGGHPRAAGRSAS